MPLSVDLDELPHAIIREQEDEKEKESVFNENRKSLEDYIDTKIIFGINETDLITSAENKNLKNYCRAQDAAYWEEELKDLMENVKKVHKAFSEDAKIDEVFRFRSEDFEDQKVIKSNDDLKIFIEEIEKMDAILRLKVIEEKKVKLSRIQAEEESRHILTTLSHHKAFGGIKVNLEEFTRLLNEVEKIECDPSSRKPTEMDGCFGNDVKDEEKKQKATCQQRKANNLKFIERNIQLARCGRGTLSLTDEEKLRIESLLADVELCNTRMVKESKETGVLTAKNNMENEKEIFGIDNETRSILSEIDERLEMMTKVRRTEGTGYPSKIRYLKQNDWEKKISEEKAKEREKENENENENEEDENKGKRGEKKQRNRLKKINEQLNSINTISVEEIYPLTKEELEKLIRESMESPEKDQENGESASEGVLSPHKLITELVSNAKLLMPKFKYRFDEC